MLTARGRYHKRQQRRLFILVPLAGLFQGALVIEHSLPP